MIMGGLFVIAAGDGGIVLQKNEETFGDIAGIEQAPLATGAERCHTCTPPPTLRSALVRNWRLGRGCVAQMTDPPVGGQVLAAAKEAAALSSAGGSAAPAATPDAAAGGDKSPAAAAVAAATAAEPEAVDVAAGGDGGGGGGGEDLEALKTELARLQTVQTARDTELKELKASRQLP